jgi:hypothetical protein
MPSFINTCIPQRRVSSCQELRIDEMEESRYVNGEYLSRRGVIAKETAEPSSKNVPSLHSSSSYGSLCDDDLLLTPPTIIQELVEGDAVDSICLKPTQQDLDWLKSARGSKPPAFLLIHKGRVIACLDNLDPLMPSTKTEATWTGGLGRWKKPVGNGSVDFDVRGWCIASKSYAMCSRTR